MRGELLRHLLARDEQHVRGEEREHVGQQLVLSALSKARLAHVSQGSRVWVADLPGTLGPARLGFERCVAYGEAQPQQALVLVADLAEVEAGGVEGRADLQLHRGLVRVRVRVRARV